MSIVLQFFPNGEFSQGVDTSKKRRDKQRRDTGFKPKPTKERRDEYLQWQQGFRAEFHNWALHPLGSQYMSPNLYTYTLRESSETHCILEWSDLRGALHRTTCSANIVGICFQWKLTPLVHQSVESCEKPETPIIASSRKKLESMTKSMARNIRNGVYLIEQEKGGKDCISFLTLTLPDLSSDGLNKCCQNWDYMVKRFIDWLRVRVEGKDMTFLYVYCTEIQTKRLENRNEYAPHLHLVFRGRDGKKAPWVVTPAQCRKAWSACIASVVDELFNRSALENLQRIRKSAARYLSKYMSKGKCSIPQDASGTVTGGLRTQWGGMARLISRRIHMHTVRIASDQGHHDFVDAFLRSLPKLLELKLIRYYRKGFIELGRSSCGQYVIGLTVHSGGLSIPTYENGLGAIFGYIEESIQWEEYLTNC